MAFNSFVFLAFLAFAFLAFRVSPKTIRLRVLFCLGYIFYGFWSVELSLFLLIFTFISYFYTHLAFRIYDKSSRLMAFYVLIAIQTLPLLYFKYTNFFLENLSYLTYSIFKLTTKHNYEILLPLGISFYVFQSISYSIDCFKNERIFSKSFIEYSTYISFFPQLVAGPIVRFNTFKKSIINLGSNLELDDIFEGFKKIVFGLSLKLLLADNIGMVVDSCFDAGFYDLSGWDVWTIAFLFGFQIYFDFSAYSMIAIGAALLFGIRFEENFNYPYLAQTPREFWKRWHISLSNWVRDYLYLPLVDRISRSNQKQESRHFLGGSVLPLFLSWLIMGLWHGASWNFLIWGIGHAALILLFRLASSFSIYSNSYVRKSISYILTLGTVMALWIPFRAETVSDTLTLWVILLNPFSYNSLNLNGNVYLLALITVIIFYIGSILRLEKAEQKKSLISSIFTSITLAAALALSLIFLQVKQQFIYFQF